MIDTRIRTKVLQSGINIANKLSQIINHYLIETVNRDYNWKEANSHVANLLNCFFNIEQLLCKVKWSTQKTTFKTFLRM